MTQRIRWLKIVIEGAVIVGSILLAFGIEASWAEHGQRVDQELTLESLRANLVATVGVLGGRNGIARSYEACE